jgi:2-iminobutanoate/2-iminopropanoate deaminase
MAVLTYNACMQRALHSDQAPAALGSYSQAIQAGPLIFCSGQLGIDPADGLLASGVAEQTRQALQNLAAVLASAGDGVDLANVVKVEVYLKDMNDFAQMNEVYASFFHTDPQPARVTVEVARLPKDALVEISCTAYLPDSI